MNRTAKRFGKAAGELVEPAKAGRDSSHGSAIVTPAPRKTVRREMRRGEFCVRWDILITCFLLTLLGGHIGPLVELGAALIQELRA